MLPITQLVYQMYNNMLGTVCRAWLFWHVYCITVPIIDEHFQCNLNMTSGFPFPPIFYSSLPFFKFFLTAIFGGVYTRIMLHLFHLVYIVLTVHCTFALDLLCGFILWWSLVVYMCIVCCLFLLMFKYHYAYDIIREVFKIDVHFSNMKWENDWSWGGHGDLCMMSS